MPKKQPSDKNKADLIKTDPSVEQKVKQMMEPSDSTSAPEAAPAAPGDPPTAPMVSDLPVPKEPLKIKIIREDDEPNATESNEPASAPELAAKALKNLEAATAKPVEPEPSPDTPIVEKQPERKVSPQADPLDDEPPEDTETARAVEDIVRHESDELLQAEDSKLLAAHPPAQKKGFGQKLKSALADIWRNPRKRKVLIASIVLALFVVGAVPQSRYFLLNAFGVRASTSVHVLDESTLQPLKNVKVRAHGVEVLTDDNGNAKIEKIKLGSTELQIEKRAFAPVSRKVTIGWGSNPQGEERLRPTGTQYAFVLSDYLSGKAVSKAEITSGDADAFSDESGKALLTMEDPDDEIDITISSAGRRTEKFKFNADTKTETSVKMVPARKHAYISRRDGRYDVYAKYADGRDEAQVLKGTGSEKDDMVLVPHPAEDMVALVSTREGKRNKDGYLLSTLTLVNLQTKKAEAVQSSERIQVVGWFNDRIVYVRVVSGESASSPDRNRLMAYHFRDDTNNQLATSNYFNDVMAVRDRVYYAPSGAYQKGDEVKLFSIKPDGSDKKTVIDREVWNMFRTRYDHISLSVPGAWYDYRIGDERTTVLSGEPANLTSIVFSDSPNNEQSLWVDTRDGKGSLMLHDTKSGQDKTIRTQTGLKNPIRWLNDSTVVYRIKNDTETADYVMSLDGGEPKKIANVTNTDGIDRWYYY